MHFPGHYMPLLTSDQSPKNHTKKGILPPFPPKNQLFKIKLPYTYVPVASYGICTG